MVDAILTPLDFSEAEVAGRRRFWKQILPITSIDYDGTKIDFDHAFHKDLDLAFKDGAYDQVPLVFAGETNNHNMDPRNFGGEIVKMENRGKSGTWALIEADRQAARAIRKNPKLGVSARIVQNLKKADGRTFKRAVNHVLLTMNPRVSGMEPWQAVDLSEDADIDVVDLTAETYEEGKTMGSKTTTRASQRRKKVDEIDLSALSNDEFQRLLDLAAVATEDDEDIDEDDLDDEDLDQDEIEDPSPAVRKKKSKTKITVEKESEDDGEDDEDEDPEIDTDLSEATVVQIRETRNTVRSMQIDLAETRWNAERGEFTRNGVPPFLLDLAEPLLSQPDVMVLDLADGESEVDVQATLRKMLTGVQGLVDLSDETGHQVDLSHGIDDKDPDKAMLDQWSENYG